LKNGKGGRGDNPERRCLRWQQRYQEALTEEAIGVGPVGKKAKYKYVLVHQLVGGAKRRFAGTRNPTAGGAFHFTKKREKHPEYKI